MALWKLPAELGRWITSMASVLDPRLSFRLLTLAIGMVMARGRRTVSSWLRGGGLQDDYKSYYYFLGSLGRKLRWVGSILLSKLKDTVLQALPPGERILLTIDDSPTKRYGPWVEGAGIHHNPTPGPAQQQFVYGHVWVTLAVAVRHALWGTIGLPLWALLYVRQKDIAPLTTLYKVAFRSKLELAAQLLEWAVFSLERLRRKLWVAVDGGYAKRPFLHAAKKAKVTVVGRLRKDAALKSLPEPRKPGQRGRRAIYGKSTFSLAKRAGQKQGWQHDTFMLYGEEKRKTDKTVLATYQPAEGMIRVVLVKEGRGWVAFFCTDPEASVAQILEAVADRTSLEQVFHDVKEVHGAGQQQLRNYWANMAAFNLNLWLQTLIELWAWNQPHEALADRSASPWDDPARRPSHADRRNALRYSCLQAAFPCPNLAAADKKKLQNLWNQLAALAA